MGNSIRMQKVSCLTHMCRPSGDTVISLSLYINYVPTLCMHAGTALVRLQGCASSSEPLLLASALSTEFSFADSVILSNK